MVCLIQVLHTVNILDEDVYGVWQEQLVRKVSSIYAQFLEIILLPEF